MPCFQSENTCFQSPTISSFYAYDKSILQPSPHWANWTVVHIVLSFTNFQGFFRTSLKLVTVLLAVISDSMSLIPSWSMRRNIHHHALRMTQTSLWRYAPLSTGHRVRLGFRFTCLTPRGIQEGRLILFVQTLFNRVSRSHSISQPSPWRQQQTYQLEDCIWSLNIIN